MVGTVIGGEAVPVLRPLLPIVDEGADSEETHRPILHFIGQRRILPVLATRHRLSPETVHVARHLIHESQPLPSQRDISRIPPVGVAVRISIAMGDEMAHTPSQGKLQHILDRADPQGSRGEKRLRTLLVIPRLHDAVSLLPLLVHDRLRLILIGTQQIDIEESLFQRVVQLRPIVHVIMQIGITSLDLDGVNRLFYRTQLAQRGGIAANTSLQTKTLLTRQVIEERETGVEVVFGLRQTIPLIIGDTQQRDPHGVIQLVQFTFQLTVCRAAHLRQVGLIAVPIAIGVVGERVRMVQARTEA